MKHFTLADEFDEFLDALEHRNDFTLNRGKYRELEDKLDSISELNDRIMAAVKAGPPAKNADQYLQSLWEQTLARYNRVAEEWTKVITDPLNALTHAALFDVKEERTADFIEAYGDAQDKLNAFGAVMPAEDRLEKFSKLVRQVETFWDVAYEYADVKSYSWLPAEERRQAELADKFLRMASDANDSISQRALAAEKALAALRNIHSIRLPKTVHGELVAMSAKALTSGSSS